MTWKTREPHERSTLAAHTSFLQQLLPPGLVLKPGFLQLRQLGDLELVALLKQLLAPLRLLVQQLQWDVRRAHTPSHAGPNN